MTHPSEITKAREALATAMLLEYKDRAWTKQQILIPSIFIDNEWTRPLMVQRWIASHSPRKQWRIYRGPTPTFEGEVTPERAMALAAQAVSYFAIHKQFETGLAEKFSTRTIPFVVADLTEADAREARAGKAPAALLRRIQRARTEAGYPEHPYEWESLATPITSL